MAVITHDTNRSGCQPWAHSATPISRKDPGRGAPTIVTWSIVAREPDTGALAVAVATRGVAVGSRCPFVKSATGAVCTQSVTNRYLGAMAVDGLSEGLTAAQALDRAIERDDGRDLRQLHIIDSSGRTAAWTGRHCVAFCGHRSAENFSVAGNMLTKEGTLERIVEVFVEQRALPLPERMLAAMIAGEEAGGNWGGTRSAALLLTTTEDFPDIDLRVDHHEAPLQELQRLLDTWASTITSLRDWTPSKRNPAGQTDLAAWEERWRSQGLNVRFQR